MYAIVVRGSEYDIPPDMLDDIIAQSISTPSVKLRRGHRDAGSGNEYEDEIWLQIFLIVQTCLLVGQRMIRDTSSKYDMHLSIGIGDDLPMLAEPLKRRRLPVV